MSTIALLPGITPSPSLSPPSVDSSPPKTAPPPISHATTTTATYHIHNRYRDVYHLTQLGAHHDHGPDPDPADPADSGFGMKPGDPQGFLVYCEGLESMTVLPPLPLNLRTIVRRRHYSRPPTPTTTTATSPSTPTLGGGARSNSPHAHGPTSHESHWQAPRVIPLLHAPEGGSSTVASMVRSESVPAESSSPHLTRQSSPALPLYHGHSHGHGHGHGHSSQGPQRDKLAFHPFRGSDKATNRKSTPEFDRKATATGSNDGSIKSKKPKGKSGKKKSDNERLARKEEKRRRAHGPPIIIKALEDFPDEALKLVKKTKIPDQQLLDNISVIVHIIRFRTGFNVRTEEEMVKSREEKGGAEKDMVVEEVSLARPLLTESAGGSENLADLGHSAANSTNKPEESVNASRQKDKDDFDSDALDPSIIPRGGEDLLSEAPDIKKLYKNLQQAGRGGFGSVFVAKSTQDKCDIAIKKLPHITKKMKRTNFNEIGFLNSCKHTNIVKYYRSHLIDDEIWVVMEYMQGGTLAEAVERYSFAESSVAYVAREILRALEYLHNHNLVHRDLKSANVMLTVEGKIKLIDFGLCVDFTQRKLCHMAGSPFWMPPEMILGVPHGTSADMWSFAICLLELANGEPPNRKSPVRAMFLAATEGILLPPEKYSQEFTDFLAKCLQIDHTKRVTASELLKHPFLNKADTQDTMRKILAQIFISNAISNLDYGL